MTLKSFYGKNVSIVCTDGQVFNGVVDEYFFPEDNDNGEESIVLKMSSSKFIEFTSSEIEKIMIN